MARRASGGDAITVLTVDHPVNGETLKKIAKLPNVKEVKYISL